jgi:hypothetical protein
VCWRYETRDGKPTTKVPFTPTGSPASSTDPSTWFDFVTCSTAAGFDGVGYVFAADDSYTGVDFDDCLDGDRLDPHVATHLLTLDSYTEISPSGRGVKTIVKAAKTTDRCRTSKTQWGGEFEVYDRDRYFTITGRHLRGTPTTIEPRQAELERVVQHVFPKPETSVAHTNVGGVVGVDDEALLERARAAANGAKFGLLWVGDATGYGSESEADLALVSMLAFWTGPDPARIDSLFRRSGLMREKWERNDYRARTIAKALERGEFYSGGDERWEPDPASGLPRQPDDPDNRTNDVNASNQPGSGCPATDRTAPGQPPLLASEPAILDVLAADLRRRGVAGEERLGKLIYLALTSRLLPWGRSTNRPVSLLIRGTTATGKSWTVTVVTEFFPERVVVDLGSMSKRFLFYDEESYAHRVLLIPEAAQVIDDDELLALLRTLLSEGRVVHGTVVGEGKPTAHRIVKEGPTALVTSTTRVHLDDELETRMLAVRTDDTPEQTRRVFEIHAGLERDGSGDFDFERWHDLQLWLAQAENRVVVPFIDALAKLMPAGATRLRRDFVSMLCLVRASALLHQQTRERDATGRVVATIADYLLVRDLIGDVIAEGVDAGVSPAIRETVEAVRSLLDDGRDHVTPRQLEQELGVGRSATYDRIRRALQGGWLANTAGKDERGMRLVIGTPLPGDDEYLPTVDEVVRLTSSGYPDTAKAHG